MPDTPEGIVTEERLAEDELGITYRARTETADDDLLLTVYHPVVADRQQRRRLKSALAPGAALRGLPGLLAEQSTGFTPEGHPYLVTALPDGPDLAGTLAARGPLPVHEVVRVGVELVSALSTVHRKGVLHLDVRPGNVWLDGPSSDVRLRGMGVLRALRAVAGLTVPPSLLVHAPSESLGWQTPSPATDVYQLGATLYTLLAGTAAYAAEARLGQAALYHRVLRGDPPRLARPDVPADLAAAVYGAMATDPTSRPALAELGEALTAATTQPARRTIAAARTAPQPDPLPQPTGSAAPAAAEAAATTVTSGPTAQPEATVAPAETPPAPDTPQPAATAAEAAPEQAAPPAPAPHVAPKQEPEPTPAPSPAPVPAPAPSPAPTPESAKPPAPRSGYLGLALLVGLAVVALLAGLVWGAATRGHGATAAGPATSSPGPPLSASLLAEPLQDKYLATRVTAAPEAGGGVLVSWQSPQRTDGITQFIVVAQVNNRPASDLPVGPGGRSVAFTGLARHQSFCFRVTTVVRATAGNPPGYALTQPVCAVSD